MRGSPSSPRWEPSAGLSRWATVASATGRVSSGPCSFSNCSCGSRVSRRHAPGHCQPDRPLAWSPPSTAAAQHPRHDSVANVADGDSEPRTSSCVLIDPVAASSPRGRLVGTRRRYGVGTRSSRRARRRHMPSGRTTPRVREAVHSFVEPSPDDDFQRMLPGTLDRVSAAAPADRVTIQSGGADRRAADRVRASLREASRLSMAACTSARHGNLRTALRNRLHPDRPRRLLMHPVDQPDSASTRRINRLVSGLGAGSNYLEIGVRGGGTFENVLASKRTGVEPYPVFDPEHLPSGTRMFVMTSDEFFATIGPGNEVRCRLRRWAPSLRAGVSRHDQRDAPPLVTRPAAAGRRGAE